MDDAKLFSRCFGILKYNGKNGFTLIEILLVISIIGFLASASFAAFNIARNNSKYAKARADMDQLRKAMLAYKIDTGELPPPGDSCSSCSNPPDSSWLNVINSLKNGGYLAARIDRDPWGNYYGYDDNDCNSNPGVTNLFTAGADKVSGTSDDYRINITQGCGN